VIVRPVDLAGTLSHRSREVRRHLALASSWSEQPAQPAGTALARVRTFRRLCEREIDDLVLKYRGGATIYELARQFGVHRVTVGKHLRSRGIETLSPGLPATDVPRAEALYRQGWSLARVAERYGTSARTVRARLLGAGVVMRDTHGRER
jgi:hypothetical protein